MPPPAPSSLIDSPHQPKGLQLRLLLLCGLALLSFILCGGILYTHQEETIFQEHGETLHSIAQLQINQILAWRQERLADARMHASGMVRSLSLEWLQSHRPELLAEAKQRLRFFQENEGYTNMLLTDSRGDILLSLVPRITSLQPEESQLIRQVVETRQIVLGDLFFCQTCARPHVEVAAPILAGDRVALVLLLVADPHRDLYPIVQSWPIASRTAESTLVRKEGDSLLYLSQLRHNQAPVLTLRVPLAKETEPAVQSVLGKTGLVQGVDYRGVEVLADLNPIPGTGWHMVTKMDTSGLRAEARYRVGMVLLLLCMTTVLAGFLVQYLSLVRRKSLSEALLHEEQQHRQTQEEIRATLYSIGEGVIATDARGWVTRMNPEAERLTGWSEQEALGLPLAMVYRVVDEESGLIVELPVARVLREGETVGMSNHTLLRSRDGGSRPVADSAAPIRNDKGDIAGVVMVIRDQTKRRAMEKAKSESMKKYTDLVESVSDFIWETGPDHHFTFANSRCLELFGIAPKDFVGRSIIDRLQQPDDSCEDGEAIQAAITGRLPFNQLCCTFLRLDGAKVVLESSAIPGFDQQGGFLGYRGISRDITERKKAEEEQRRLEAQLLHAQKMEVVGRLAGGVAHDFNNMLTIIGSYVEMTLDELSENHRLYKRLSEVHHAAQHSAELTRQLLTFARRQPSSPKVLNLNEAITNALKMLQRLIGEHIELRWQPGSDHTLVLIDPTQLYQVLANLAVNARDAIAAAGHLDIAVSRIECSPQDRRNLHLDPGAYAVITVRDDGCGMEQATISRIFEPYFTTKEEGRGTGLGLATVYGILTQNKGAVTVFSQPGQGATFSLYLPLVTSSETVDWSAPPQLSAPAKETILFVEDELAILELGQQILGKLGYTILAAPTPAQALVVAQQHPAAIDLLVTDVIMPEMNGQELAQKIAIFRPDIKILYISGYTADVISRHGVLHPGVHFLEKPFTSGNLGKKVREVLENASPNP